APFEEATGIDVRYVGAGSFALDIQDRVAEGDFPDVAMFPQPAIMRDLAARGVLTRLDDALVEQLDLDRPGVQIGAVGGDLYGVWFRAAAKSLVWFRPDVFAAAGYEVPSTWDEMMALGDEMKIDGVAPWCLGMESFGATGWVGTDWIEDIVLREQGAVLYDDWVSGDVLFSSSEIRGAFSTFSSIIHSQGSVLGGTNRILNESWQRAADPMFEDSPRCMMQKQASFWASQAPPSSTFGETLDFFVLPGLTQAPPPIEVSGDVAAAFNDRPEVVAFMAFLASPEAGVGWARLGGFTSPNPDFDSGAYVSELDRRVGEVIAAASVVRFDGSDLMPPVVGTGAFWRGIRAFVRSGDVVSTVTTIDDAWPRPELRD
ncbi:MAG: ABC transporter substrate-binding protein, partial [Actinomycetia bacterium]|nr:ABC transporter substrate-binding protein [Actinomycetes bacterium]